LAQDDNRVTFLLKTKLSFFLKRNSFIFASNKNKFMSLRKYLTSRVFFLQVLSAVAIIAVLGYLFMHWLTFTTDHGHEIEVPNLSKLTEEQVEAKLSDLDLDYVLLDSVDYRSEFPKYSVVEQDPLPGTKVKVGRKIYIKINASGFSSVKIPDLIEKTYREAVPTLKALGLQEGTITYIPNLGKDMVLEMRYKGRNLKVGDRVLKASKIDLVLGDGKASYVDESQATDSLAAPTTETPKDEQ
jgi:beta-lactam-binding protein with PASTA domain